MNKNNNNNNKQTPRAVLAVVMVVVLLATLTLTAGAYVDGTGTETDVQPSQYMVYYPFSVSAYGETMRTLSYAVDTFYSLGSLGADEYLPNSNVVQTGTPAGDFVLYYFEDTDNFEFRLEPTENTDRVDGGGLGMNMYTQIYITGIGYDRVHGYNNGRLSVEVNQDMYDEGYLYIDYYTLDGSGNVRQAEYENYVPSFEVNDVLEEICGDYLAVYVNELSYEVSYQFPPDYPSTYRSILTVSGNGFRTGTIMNSSNVGVKNGAWWGNLISGFRDITDYSFSDWITTAFGGFFGTELFGFFSLGDILLWVLGIGLIVVFIKMFAGG